MVCGVCGLVDVEHGAVSGPACPRCGSRTLDVTELPVVASWWPAERDADAANVRSKSAAWGGATLTGSGGTHVPMTRAA